MKKSQMLGDIYDILYMNTDINEDTLQEITIEIMNKIESNGMLPPYYGKESTTYSEISGVSVEHPLYTIRNQWESEDEKNNIDRLFELFASEFVTVMIDKDVEQITQTEESIQTMKHPISFAGYLTDADDEYVYLGVEQNTISQAVKRNLIAHIELADPSMLEEDIIPTPQNKGLN